MAKSDVLGTYMDQIPVESLIELGKIFGEGMLKYGENNWQQNVTDEYRKERIRHAIRHLMLYANGDRSENHVAKVMWFASTEIYHQQHSGEIGAKKDTKSIGDRVRNAFNQLDSTTFLINCDQDAPIKTSEPPTCTDTELNDYNTESLAEFKNLKQFLTYLAENRYIDINSRSIKWKWDSDDKQVKVYDDKSSHTALLRNKPKEGIIDIEYSIDNVKYFHRVTILKKKKNGKEKTKDKKRGTEN